MKTETPITNQTTIEEFFKSRYIAAQAFEMYGATTCQELLTLTDDEMMKIRIMGKIRVHKFRQEFGYGDPAEVKYRGPRWKYQWEECFYSRIHEAMNDLGSIGWELVSAVPAGQPNKVNLFFKRLI